MPVERVRIEPERMVLKNSDGSVAFDTNNNYIRTDVAGEFSLQQVGAVPIPTSRVGHLQFKGANVYFVRLFTDYYQTEQIYPPVTTEMSFSSDGYLMTYFRFAQMGAGVPIKGVTWPSDTVVQQILIDGTSVLDMALDAAALFQPGVTSAATGVFVMRKIMYQDASRVITEELANSIETLAGLCIKIKVFAGETITYIKTNTDTVPAKGFLLDEFAYHSDEKTLPLALSK